MLLLTVEQAILTYIIRQLSSRCDFELRKNIRQVSTNSPRRNIEYGPDVLIRFPLSYHSRNLDLATGESRRSLGNRPRRRPNVHLAQLLTNLRKTSCCAESRKSIVRFLELADRALAVATVLHRNTERASNSCDRIRIR